MFRQTALLILVCAGSVAAQDTIRIDDSRICRRCRIELRPYLRLGTDDGPGALAGEPTSVVRDSQGRYYVTMADRQGEPPMVFDSTGRFLARLGPVGDGPGEFRRVRFVAVEPGDTVYAYDIGHRRISVLDSSLTLVRTISVPYLANGGVVTSGGGLVLNFSARTPERAGFSMHSLTPSKGIRRSYDPFTVIPGEIWRWLRALAVAPDGSVWTANVAHEYHLRRWRGDEAPLVVLRQAEWFPPMRTAVICCPSGRRMHWSAPSGPTARPSG